MISPLGFLLPFGHSPNPHSLPPGSNYMAFLTTSQRLPIPSSTELQPYPPPASTWGPTLRSHQDRLPLFLSKHEMRRHDLQTRSPQTAAQRRWKPNPPQGEGQKTCPPLTLSDTEWWEAPARSKGFDRAPLLLPDLGAEDTAAQLERIKCNEFNWARSSLVAKAALTHQRPGELYAVTIMRSTGKAMSMMTCVTLWALVMADWSDKKSVKCLFSPNWANYIVLLIYLRSR